jgi:hypothetical protein
MGACGGSGYKASMAMTASKNKMRPHLFLVFEMFICYYLFFMSQMENARLNLISS